MWKSTKVTEIFKIKFPIIQGPFGGGVSSAALASAVSNAGGLGSFGAHHLEKGGIRKIGEEIRKLTKAPFALNLWIPTAEQKAFTLTQELFDKSVALLGTYYDILSLQKPRLEQVKFPNYEEQIEAVLDVKPAAFSFVFGIPSAEILQEFRKRSIITMGAATNVDEALALEAAGVDIIVASGSEAGGHRVSFLRDVDESLALSALLPQVVDKVKIPVIAAGGIADGRGIASAFVFGAAGVQIGTAFVACEESNASQSHRTALRLETSRYTALTKVFSGRWARGIKNRFMAEMKPHENEIAPYPLQNWLTTSIRSAAGRSGKTDYMALWSGQNAPLLKHTRAADVVRYLVEDTDRVFAKLAK